MRGSQFRVIVVLECALDESLDRALLRLAADSRCTRGTLFALAVFVRLVLPAGGMADIVPLLPCPRDAMGAGRNDLVAFVVVGSVLVATSPDGTTFTMHLVDLGRDLPVCLEVIHGSPMVSSMAGRSNGGRVAARPNGAT